MSCDLGTLEIQAGYHASEYNHAVSVSTYQTTAFALRDNYRADRLSSFSESDPIYTRLSSPTVDAPKKCTAMLYSVSDAVALASGMTVASYVPLSIARKSGRILTTTCLYGGTVDSLGHLFPELGVETDFMENPGRMEGSEEKLTPDIKTILIRSLTNLFVTILDFEAITRIAHVYGILLIVNNTVVTPYLSNPFEHGADVAVCSVTKAFSSHENVIVGPVLENGTFDYDNGDYPHFEKSLWFLRDEHDEPHSILQVFPQNPFTGRLRAVHLNYFGVALSPFGTYLVLIGLETLSEWVVKQVSNTLAVLEYLEQNECILWVCHPYVQGSKYRALVDRYFLKGTSSISSFGFRDAEEQKRAFLASVGMFGYQVNIGDARSLIINPAQTTHIELTEEQRLFIGLGVSAIRLSPGLESPKDLIEDLQQTFDSVSQD